MPDAARHFVIATWLSALAPPDIDIHTAALAASSSARAERQDNDDR